MKLDDGHMDEYRKTAYQAIDDLAKAANYDKDTSKYKRQINIAIEIIYNKNIKDIWPTAKWIYSHRSGFGNAIGYCSNCNVRTEKTNYCHNCGYKFKED